MIVGLGPWVPEPAVRYFERLSSWKVVPCPQVPAFSLERGMDMKEAGEMQIYSACGRSA